MFSALKKKVSGSNLGPSCESPAPPNNTNNSDPSPPRDLNGGGGPAFTTPATRDDNSTLNGTIGNSTMQQLSRYHDEPEVDYDAGPTELYRRIENKDWDGAIARAEVSPVEAKTWVSRRELHDPNKIRWRLLPIHATCIFRSPLSLIEILIKAYPDGPQMKDDQGMLPVHLACRNGASKGVVLTLLTAFPESIDVKDRKGRIPLNLVEASQSQNKEAVIIAMKKFKNDLNSQTLSPTGVGGGASAMRPPATTPLLGVMDAGVAGGGGGAPSRPTNEVDYEHRTVLFRLVLKKDWDAASNRATQYPDEASTYIVTKGFNGNLRFLPLHKACVLQPPESVVEALIASFPEGAKSRDQDGWLPIHCACFYGASEAVVNTLLVAHPKGAQAKDDEGRLPIHYACLKGATEGVVSSLLGGFPKGAMSKDDEGRLPIHHACSKGAPDGVVEALLKASPKGAQSKDDQGRLPLHHACRKNGTERVIKTLLRVYPRAAQLKDDQDKLPIHYACQNGASESVVNVLLAAFPESINVKNGFGYTPLAEARAMDNPKLEPIIAVLEKFKAEQDQIKAESGESPSLGAISGQQVQLLEAKIAQLTQRTTALEDILLGVSKLGKQLKTDLKKGKDTKDAMTKFAEKLASINIGNDGGGRSNGGGGAGGANENAPLQNSPQTQKV